MRRLLTGQTVLWGITSMSIAGFLLILVGIVLVGAMGVRLTIGVVGTAAGLILEALGYLFFRQMDLANQRMDGYHQELLQTYWVEFLLSVAERLPPARESICVEKMIYAVVNSWYPHQIDRKSTLVMSPATKTEEKSGN